MNVFLLEYRGFGLSEGSDPSERSLVEDARVALLFLNEKLSKVSNTAASVSGREAAVTVNLSSSVSTAASDASANTWGSRIIVLGSSIGGAVAVQLLSDPAMAARVYCLIVENTFTSVPDMARVILASTLPPIAPCVKHLPDRLLRNQVPTSAQIAFTSTSSVTYLCRLCAVSVQEAHPRNPHADTLPRRTGRSAGAAPHDASAIREVAKLGVQALRRISERHPQRHVDVRFRKL